MTFKRLSCRKRLALLCDYLDKELPPESREAVAAHRRSCLPCAEILAGLTRTVGLLKTLRGREGAPASARRAWKKTLAEGLLAAPRAAKRPLKG